MRAPTCTSPSAASPPVRHARQSNQGASLASARPMELRSTSSLRSLHACPSAQSATVRTRPMCARRATSLVQPARRRSTSASLAMPSTAALTPTLPRASATRSAPQGLSRTRRHGAVSLVSTAVSPASHQMNASRATQGRSSWTDSAWPSAPLRPSSLTRRLGGSVSSASSPATPVRARQIPA